MTTRCLFPLSPWGKGNLRPAPGRDPENALKKLYPDTADRYKKDEMEFELNAEERDGRQMVLPAILQTFAENSVANIEPGSSPSDPDRHITPEMTGSILP